MPGRAPSAMAPGFLFLKKSWNFSATAAEYGER
jgi:hypothetical protein